MARRSHSIDFKAATMVTLDTDTIQVAVIGSGLACASGLQCAGARVTLFEKAKTVGGHTATRRAGRIDASGAEQSVTQPDRGPLDWVLRNDRVPGRTTPPGLAVWTAHATAKWSAAHSEDDPQAVNDNLQSALRARLPTPSVGNRLIHFHYANVHSGRYPGLHVDCSDSSSNDVWWDESLGLGVCGNLLGDSGVEVAWYSGDELADCMAASFERTEVPGCGGAATSTPTHTTSNIHSRLMDPPAVVHQTTLALAPPIQCEARQFSVAGLKVSHRTSFSNR